MHDMIWYDMIWHIMHNMIICNNVYIYICRDMYMHVCMSWLTKSTGHSGPWHEMTFPTSQAHRMFSIPLFKNLATFAKLKMRNYRGWNLWCVYTPHSNLHSKLQCHAHRGELLKNNFMIGTRNCELLLFGP